MPDAASFHKLYLYYHLSFLFATIHACLYNFKYQITSTLLFFCTKNEDFIMGEITYQPLRSLIYVDCVKEEYRHKLQHWLYYYHAPGKHCKI